MTDGGVMTGVRGCTAYVSEGAAVCWGIVINHSFGHKNKSTRHIYMAWVTELFSEPARAQQSACSVTYGVLPTPRPANHVYRTHAREYQCGRIRLIQGVDFVF